jgi:hypothetical protein
MTPVNSKLKTLASLVLALVCAGLFSPNGREANAEAAAPFAASPAHGPETAP